MNLNNAIIVPISKKERLLECFNKKVYGFSDAIFRRVRKNLLDITPGSNIYLRYKDNMDIILGNFVVTEKPKMLTATETYGLIQKVEIREDSKNLLPWWIGEGFSWLIFFEIENVINYIDITKDYFKNSKLNILEYQILSSEVNNTLRGLIDSKGNNIKDIFNI